jgi:hypothetical protein
MIQGNIVDHAQGISRFLPILAWLPTYQRPWLLRLGFLVLDLVRLLLPPAFSVFMLSYVEGMSMARTFADKHHDPLAADQEAPGSKLLLAEVSDGALEQLERTGLLEKLGEAGIFPETPRVDYATRQAMRAGESWLSAPPA